MHHRGGTAPAHHPGGGRADPVQWAVDYARARVEPRQVSQGGGDDVVGRAHPGTSGGIVGADDGVELRAGGPRRNERAVAAVRSGA